MKVPVNGDAVPHGVAIAPARPYGLEPAAAPGAGLVVGTIALLATGALPEYLTALVFFSIAVLLAVAPADVVFAGFHSTAFWLVFGGLVMGVGVRRTGLADRLAGMVGARLGGSYAGLIGGCDGPGVGPAFLMPSTMGRTLVLMPIIVAMAEGFGYAEGSKGRTGMVLAAGFSTMIPAFAILPATVPAVLQSGMAETLYGVTFVYGQYLLLHFPVGMWRGD